MKKSYFGIFILGCLFIIRGITWYIEYNNKGYIAHPKFNFTETGTVTVCKILITTIAGIVIIGYWFYIKSKSSK
jgi:hypothetical protein